MRTRRIAALAVGGLLLAACGSDSGGPSGAQGEAADAAIAAADEEGFALDEGCVNDLAGQLSDDDAQAIVDGGPDGDAALSPEGEDLSLQLLTCVDGDELVDQFIEGMNESGQAFDEACARERLEDFDIAALVAAGEGAEPPDDLIQVMIDCIEIGG